MDLSFFGLDDDPFRRADDDVQGGYLAAAHAQLTTELRAGLKAPHGITLLIGEEGAGKTTLVKSFAARLTDSCTVAYLPSTGPGLRHLLIEIIEQLGGAASEGGSERALLEALRSLAKARAEHERATVVIIDDAHDLPAKTIERLGKIFGDDPADPSMLHIILVGRAELLDRMNAATDRSILKHLVQVCRMDPIGPEESFRYIADRIAKVGGTVDRIFTEDALRLIVKRANGLPAQIDAICTAALSEAAQRGEESIGTETVDLACMDLDGFALEPTDDSNGAVEQQSYAFGDEPEPPAYGRADDDHAEMAPPNRDEYESEELQDEEIEMHEDLEVGPSDGDQRQSVPTGRGRPAGMLGALLSYYEGRRRLVLWALGLVAVVGVFAAMMTGTREQPTTRVANVERQSPSAPAAGRSADVDVSGKPQAIPNLVVTRSGTRPPGEEQASAEQAGDQAAAARAEAAAAAATRATGGAAASAPAERPVVQSPPYEPTGAATAAQEAAPAAASRAIENAQAARDGAASASSEAAEAASATTKAEVARQASAPASAAAAASVAAKEERASAAPEKQGEASETGGIRIVASAPAAAAAPSEKPVMAPPQRNAAASAHAPAPASGAAASAAHEPKTGTSAAPAKARPIQTAKAEPTGGFTVQLGAFRSRSNAEALLAKLEKTKLDGRIVTTTTSGTPFYHVVSGTFASRHDAIRRAATLKQSGFSTYVRSNAPE